MPVETKIDPFRPQQPQIPGVPADAVGKKEPATPVSARSAPPQRPREIPPLWIGLAAGFVALVLGATWWAHRVSTLNTSAPTSVADTAPAAPEPVKPQQALPIGPGPIASASELAKPWSSKRFNFRDPVTSELTPALAVRLPGGALWGISLRDSYGTCQLEYVTDLEKLRSQYNFAAEHPMVANPCTRTVYDLARYAGGPNGLVRGEIVRGKAVRPPVAIEVEARGKLIVAIRAE